ncbi:Predicted membrane protein [Parapedobacter koreensis]|uniref:Predicted membrane protein n=1 Tax=Parapedobacter koreensis TaxID=332977 RepID=A0A1H7QQN6_9SPHI|nr:Predicted membrane protein [Parapedobacter koreensis]
MDEAIRYWQEQDLIDERLAEQLGKSYEVKGFDWKRLAQYAFWIALSCVVLAFLSLFADEMVLRWIERLYETPDTIICVFCLVLAIVFYFWGFINKRKYPNKTFSNEALMALGVLATATFIGYLGKIIDKGSGHFSLLFLASVVIYGILSVKLSSKLIWVFTLVSFGIWFATETAYHSNWGFRFWGMNYPLRFTLFGALLTGFAVFWQPRIKPIEPFRQISYVIGLTYLMVALWLLSIFGNYSDMDKWSQVRQWHIFYWGLLSSAVSLGLAWYGLKRHDHIAREFGIVFLIINMYTRFFEYLWDSINRAVFFLLLAASFWYIGRWAERIWNGEGNKKAR